MDKIQLIEMQTHCQTCGRDRMADPPTRNIHMTTRKKLIVGSLMVVAFLLLALLIVYGKDSHNGVYLLSRRDNYPLSVRSVGTVSTFVLRDGYNWRAFFGQINMFVLGVATIVTATQINAYVGTGGGSIGATIISTLVALVSGIAQGHITQPTPSPKRSFSYDNLPFLSLDVPLLTIMPVTLDKSIRWRIREDSAVATSLVNIESGIIKVAILPKRTIKRRYDDSTSVSDYYGDVCYGQADEGNTNRAYYYDTNENDYSGDEYDVSEYDSNVDPDGRIFAPQLCAVPMDSQGNGVTSATIWWNNYDGGNYLGYCNDGAAQQGYNFQSN